MVLSPGVAHGLLADRRRTLASGSLPPSGESASWVGRPVQFWNFLTYKGFYRGDCLAGVAYSAS